MKLIENTIITTDTDLQFVFYPSGAWRVMALFFGINIWYSTFLISSCQGYSYHGILFVISLVV